MAQREMTEESKDACAMAPRPKALRDDPDKRPSEDDLVGEHLRPRGVRGASDPARMTAERRKKMPPFHDIPPEHPK
jgi:hypothetical protein